MWWCLWQNLHQEEKTHESGCLSLENLILDIHRSLMVRDTLVCLLSHLLSVKKLFWQNTDCISAHLTFLSHWIYFLIIWFFFSPYNCIQYLYLHEDTKQESQVHQCCTQTMHKHPSLSYHYLSIHFLMFSQTHVDVFTLGKWRHWQLFHVTNKCAPGHSILLLSSRYVFVETNSIQSEHKTGLPLKIFITFIHVQAWLELMFCYRSFTYCLLLLPIILHWPTM